MKRKYSLLLLAILLAPTTVINSQYLFTKQTVAGQWIGTLDAGANSLRIIFSIKLNDRDSLVASMDSPDQGASNIPLGRVYFFNDSLLINAPYLMGNYKGSVKSDTIIKGTWTQRGAKYPLDLKLLTKPFIPGRPQDPKQPYPYISQDVTFNNPVSGFSLSGTLTLPDGKGPFTAAVLITGSGPQNRDESIAGHKPFLVLADWLTRNGIAVLRYDDRGVGRSKGNYATSTTADFASDAQAAVLFLKSDPQINSKAIGLIGHSEGGLIAPIVASAGTDVAFVVSLAGPGVSGEEIILRQAADIGRAMGMSEAAIKDAHDINVALYDVVKNEKDDNKAEQKVAEAYRKILADKKISEENLEVKVNAIRSSFGAKVYPWFRYFIMSDPAVYWKKVKCPVLAINGDRDLQVSAEINLPAIEKAVKSSGNNDVTVKSMPGLNHLFQHATTGLPSEYNRIDETFSPEALKVISDWILGLKVSK